jgi:hypothetical protein
MAPRQVAHRHAGLTGPISWVLWLRSYWLSIWYARRTHDKYGEHIQELSMDIKVKRLSFRGSSKAEANRKTDEWLGKQTGLRVVERIEGYEGNPNEGAIWTVTLRFEGEADLPDNALA